MKCHCQSQYDFGIVIHFKIIELMLQRSFRQKKLNSNCSFLNVNFSFEFFYVFSWIAFPFDAESVHFFQIEQLPQSTMNKKFDAWDRKGPEAQELVKQFNLHKSTNGQAGIDPNLAKPALIKALVYYKFDTFSRFNPERFPDNFRKLAAAWKLNEAKTSGRQEKGEKKKNLFVFLSTFTHC